MGPGGDPARLAALSAGLGPQVPGVTIDRQCGSGLEAVAQAATRVRVGGGLLLAGGVESASTAPTRLALLPDGRREPYSRARFSPDDLGDPGMGEAADALARAHGVSRERQDAYAERSHRLAVAARSRGDYAAELVAVDAIAVDERPRTGLDRAMLARFRPAFTPDGTATAGNSCSVSDGAAAVAVVDEATRARLGLPGLAVRAVAAVGVDPRLPGIGPVPAVQAVLDAAGLAISDVGALEITEAFAAQVLACTDAWGLDPLDGPGADVVCTQGGAIALGHPWGASGALLVVRLFSRMVREDGPRLGVATCAVGGGQGVAVLVERVG
jgi:acetyl-CoA C-acetyltransferase